MVLEKGNTVPYPKNTTKDVAKALDAIWNHPLFFYNEPLKLVHGEQRINYQLGKALPQTSNSLWKALNALLPGNCIEVEQQPSLGSINQWKQ